MPIHCAVAESFITQLKDPVLTKCIARCEYCGKKKPSYRANQNNNRHAKSVLVNTGSDSS